MLKKLPHPHFLLICLVAFLTVTDAFGQTTVTFNCTGGLQSWTVPPCVTSINVTVEGAQGGGANGGLGAVVTGTLAVTPGNTLAIKVGCQGGCPGAGYNGGGAGQNATGAGNPSCGGGGASSIGNLIIAGGGGGMGGGNTDSNGGNGGCNSGVQGGSSFGGGGYGGTQTAGGAGGSPWGSGSSGSPGGSGTGGLGAQDNCCNMGPGGGGGGGYYGGGGGGGDCFCSGSLGGGGGGGGSSLVPVGGGCSPGANSGPGVVTITYNATLPIAGTATATPNPICAGQTSTVTLSGYTGTIQWQVSTNGGSTWSNVGGATNATYTTPALFANTCYRAAVSGCGITVYSTMICITVNPGPTVTVNSITICAGQSGTLTATPSLTGGTYLWSPGGQTTQSITVSPGATATYSVVYTLNGCTSPSASGTVTVNPVPTVTVNNVTICAGQSATLTATPSATGGTYSWNTGATTQSITVSPATTTSYSVIYTLNGCPSLSVSGTVTVNPVPTVIVNNPTICNGQSATLTATPSITGGSYSWNTGATTQSITVSPTSTTSYSVVYTLNGCSSTSVSGTVTVNPIPTVTVNNATICNGQSATLTATPSATGGTYSWNTGATTQSITVSPTATTSYSVIYTLNGCPSTSVSGTVTVNPVPTVTVSNATICNGQSATLTATPSTTGGTYLWSPGGQITQSITVSPTATTTYSVVYTLNNCPSTSVSGTVTVNPVPTITVNNPAICIGQSTTLTATPSATGGTYLWSPGGQTTQSITVSPISTTSYSVIYTLNGCPSSSVSGTVTVNPLPVISVTPSNPTICTGNSVSLTASGASTYSWSPGTGLSATTGATVTATPTATTTYTVTGTDANGCVNTATVTVTVATNPVANAGPDVAVCIGSSTQLNASGGAVYSWTPTTGLSDPNISNPVANPSVTTTYTVTASSGTCSATDDVTVTVNPLPVVSVTPSSSICMGASTSLTASGASTYSWSPATGLSATTGAMVTANPTATTTYTVTGTDANGCVNTATVTITVNPLPIVTVSPASSTICFGGSVTLTASGASTYSWSPATGLSATTGASVIANPTVTTAYTVTGTDGNGCIDTAMATVTVVSNPIANAGPDVAICINSSTQLNASGGTTYSWSPTTGLSDPNIANPVANPTATTTYTVTATSGSCFATDDVVVTVNPLPVIAVTPAAPAICPGTSTSLTASGASTYSWSPATGLSATTGATVTATPTATTTYTVIGTDANGCVNTATVTVTVFPQPVVTISPTNPTICTGSSVTLTASGANTYSWAPSTGLSATTGATVTANPTATTTYTIIGTSIDGCTTTATVTVTVTGLPVIAVTPAAPAICIGSSVGLTASGALTYSWSPTTGLSTATGDTVTAYPTATTTYTVTGTDAGGCINSTTVTVTVNPLPNMVVAPAASTICMGDSVTLSASGANTYSWSPVAGLNTAVGATVNASPASYTTYTVTGTDINGCVNSTTASVTVNTLPVVTVNSATICTGSSTTLTASGAGIYSWSNASTLSSSTGNPVTANPIYTTSYTVTGTDMNGCVDTAIALVTVNQLPAVTGNASPQVVCTGDQVTLTGSGAVSYVWNNNVVDGVAFTPAATTTYTVTGTDANSCSNTSQVIVTVNPLPNVTANATSVVVCAGTSVTLTGGGAVSYVWDNNVTDGVAFTPTSTATYTVTGTDNNMCVNSATISVTVNPNPVVNITATQDTICIGNTTNLTATGAASYTWAPAPGLTATTGTPVMVNPTVTTTYSVTGTSAQGCASSPALITVVVNPPLNAVALTDASICIGGSVQISASGTGGNGGPYDYSWTPPAGLSNPTASNPLAAPTATTVYTVTVTDNCTMPSAVASVTITVNPLPIVAFETDTNSGCVPVILQFTNLSNASASCLWDFGDGNFDNDCDPLHSFDNVGNYNVSLTVSDTNGCTASAGNFPVQVNPYPIAHFTMGPQPTTIINPAINFNSDSSSADVTAWTWDFAGLGIDSIANPVFLFPDTGKFNVQLMVVNEFGCYDSITQRVIILGDFTIYIPNAFTPNGDGLNDFWGPKGTGITEDNYEMLVFDRWGQLIYTTNDINKPWNGVHRDGTEISLQDIYIYKITVKDSFDKKHLYQGHFTLIR